MKHIAPIIAAAMAVIACSQPQITARIFTEGETELTGRGNKAELLTAITILPSGPCTINAIDITLEGAEAVEALSIREGAPYPTGPECRNGYRPGRNKALAKRTVRPGRNAYVLPCNLKIGGKTILSICADISGNAEEGSLLSAKVNSITINGHKTEPEQEKPGQRETILRRKLLYAPGDYSSVAWRIPAILQLSDGTLLTVNDKRNDSEEDLPGKIDVVSSYSTDGGKSWSEPVFVAKNRGFMGGYGDPSLAQFPDGTVICMFCGSENFSRSTVSNPQRSYYTLSNDSGRTWSEIHELTTSIWGTDSSFPTTKHYSSNFFSSGNNLVLKKGEHKGRILTAGVLGIAGEGRLVNHAIFSDDGGKTWNASGLACPTGDEAKMAQLPDGRILMSIRTVGDRLWTISEDDGQTWGPVGHWTDMHVTNCNGDLISYDDSTLLHSIPFSMNRENISILLSHDNGKSWSERKTILEGPGQYSSLTVLNDGTIGAYLEKNTWYTELWYLNFSMAWLKRRNVEGSIDRQGTMEGVRLWKGGPVWASCNIGASKPEETGLFYAWGETAAKTVFGWGAYTFKGNEIGPDDDAATVSLQDGWRMPTEKDFRDLLANCSWTWTKVGKQLGYEVRGSLGSIFLPATGYRSGTRFRYPGDLGFYWTSTPSEGNPLTAREFSFHEFLNGEFYDRGRDNGHVIRAIKD